MLLSNYFSSNGPGAVLAVVTEGKVPYIECYGLANIPQKIKITPETVFDLASAGKTFTATAIMLLSERGDLNLDDAIQEYIPQIEKNQDSRHIKIRDLLWHTSDLPDYLDAGIYTASNQVSPEYIISQLPNWSGQARPGEYHSYCNTNYVLLGMIIEAITGLSFAEFIEANLIRPFGLHQTFVFGSTRKPQQLAVGYQDMGYGLPLIETCPNFDLQTVGDGGIFSSVNDLIQWQSLLWHGKIVHPQTFMFMQTPGKLDSGESFEYGLGLQIETRKNGQRWIGHGGSWTNATTLMGRYVQEDTLVIVLSNEIVAPVERISQRALSIATKRVYRQAKHRKWYYY